MKQLNRQNVPEKFRVLIPFAEKWGDEDDVYGNHLLETTPEDELENLVKTVADYDEALDEWLAGNEAHRKPSPEYIAFTCLRLVADMAASFLRKRKDKHAE